MESYHPFEDASLVQGDATALRHKMNQDGFLVLRGLLSTDVVANVYQAILSICQACGWADDQGWAQGEPRLEGRDDFWEVYDQVQRLEAFHALAHRPEVLAVIEALVQESPFLHPRNITRISFPKAEFFTTPAHQDYVHIQGTPETYTVWMPLRDCPIELGNLTMLAGSHKLGILPPHVADGAGGLGVDTDSVGLAWYAGDLQAGDALIFHSHTVHKAFPNRTENQLRLSVDYRYQGVSQPLVADSLEPHYGRLSWDEIYEGWQDSRLQYYWRDLSLQTVPRDRSYHEKARQEAAAKRETE